MPLLARWLCAWCVIGCAGTHAEGPRPAAGAPAPAAATAPAPVPPSAASEPNAPPPPLATAAPETPQPPETQAPTTASPAAPASPVVLHVSYGNLGTASGSDWDLHADGTLEGSVCHAPSTRRVTEAEVAQLARDLRACKLCEFAKLPPSDANYFKQHYRVTASWPDVSCAADVSARSRWHYDARAKRCHQKIEALVQAIVMACPGDLVP